jgi:hypothetical protein
MMKLTAREQRLAAIVGAAGFVFLNLLLMSAFSKQNTALRAELAQQRLEWSGMQELLGNKAMWAARDAALTAKQPTLTNENAASVELYDTVRQLAQKHSVTIENPVLNGTVDKTQWYRSVPVSVDTSSTWPELISFLYALQKPDQFIVCEAANIQLDPSDQTKMVGHFKIARWYAP